MFCQIDDFCKELDAYTQHYLLEGTQKAKRGPVQGACRLIGEIMQ